ncbi:DUF2975 domain-containing protein [Bifidobacterium sp. ESL0745]|uniref:DUF2975 domain-containing protein n=1 Tax=Bifidobacterium sp. ESL0745 TaxID=2983226 RepID=UPI0023F9EF11|nr:DUF2975 domain-containing protein [Bifidobacterium sp. ESL0745]MDF7665119.1 DUF2975 domain-containing protein [Bifidobacterium sp. ESL0745]
MYKTTKVDAFIMWAAKILEWFNIAASVVLLAGAIYLGVGQPYPDAIKDKKLPNIYGFSIDTTFQKASEHEGVIVWYAIEGIAILLIIAFAAKNLSAAFKTIHQPEIGEEPSPFRDSIIKNVHTIGWCFIAAPLVAGIMPFCLGFMSGFTQAMAEEEGIATPTSFYDTLDGSSIGLSWLIIGIFMLCITRILRYGEQLQREHDELI